MYLRILSPNFYKITWEQLYRHKMEAQDCIVLLPGISTLDLCSAMIASFLDVYDL